ncbi:hypothetical protein [Nocardia lasii]|uniref:Uncharacterized protein n=1 Tax=Nocardia lasii TaxID=1616107 RepID=A0ABW1JK56_9NOCA
MTSTLNDRYRDYRVRRWLAQEQRTATMLLSWRTPPRRRILVIAVTFALTVMAVAGVLSALDLRTAATVATLVAVVVFLPGWTVLRIVSGSVDSAPEQALDETRLVERDRARSTGLAITQSLTMAPLAYLIFAGTFAPDADAYRTAYAGGLMMLATILAGGCAPAMIMAWKRPSTPA